MMVNPKSVSSPEAWVDAHGDVLYRYALSRLQNPTAAEDVVQETFLAAMKSRDRFGSGSSERTWLIGILKHKVVDFIRKESRERPYEDLDAPDATEEQFFDKKGHWRVGLADWQVNPRKVLEQKEFMDVLKECLVHLPDRLGRIFTLREMDNTGSEEICKLFDISSTNLWVMLYRARMKLRTCLQANWFGTSEA